VVAKKLGCQQTQRGSKATLGTRVDELTCSVTPMAAHKTFVEIREGDLDMGRDIVARGTKHGTRVSCTEKGRGWLGLCLG
jgi:hypothetical protein